MLNFIVIYIIFLCLSLTTSEDEYTPENSFQFGILASNPIKFTRQYHTDGGRKVQVYDGVLNPVQIELLHALCTYKLGAWSYRLPEYQVQDGQNFLSPNNIPWYNELSTIHFQETDIGKKLHQVVTMVDGDSLVKYWPYKMTAYVLRRGDFPHVSTDAKQDDEVSMMIYLNKKWRKNDYGDLYLYNKNNDILCGIVPKYGRVVVWHSSIPFLPRPPSVAYKPGQLMIHLQFSKNITKQQQSHQEWLENNDRFNKYSEKGIFQPSINQNSVNIASHLVTQSQSKNGKKIFVFDGLFPNKILNDLRGKILNYGVFYYDDTYDEDSDNVQWIAGFDIYHFVQSHLWKITKQVATYVSDGQDEWYPYDVSCNIIRNADTTQIHHDCSEDEDEWTFLLYLNPEWRANDYGETVFYERNSDKTEIITEVLPKYGRVVIFQGIIPHSARPPSFNFTGSRLSFAVKLSENEWIGRTKAIHEQSRHIGSLREMIVAITKLTTSSDENTLPNIQSIQDDSEADKNLEELESKLEDITEQQDIDELRKLMLAVRHQHHKSIEEVGHLLEQLL